MFHIRPKQWGAVTLVAAALCLSVPSLQAYSPSPEPTAQDTTYFQATTHYRFQSFTDPSQPSWHTSSAGLSYDYGRGSITAAYDRASRFGEWDDLVTVDAYPMLGSDRYAHIRIRHAFAATVFPAREYQLEVFHLFGENWLPLISTQVRRYPSLDVFFLGAGIDVYYGSWFARTLLQSLWLNGSMGGFVSALVRHYVKDSSSYVEAHLGYGREPVVTAPGPVISEIGSSYSAGMGGQYFLSSRLGFSVMGTAIKSADLPLRLGVVTTLMYRW